MIINYLVSGNVAAAAGVEEEVARRWNAKKRNEKKRSWKKLLQHSPRWYWLRWRYETGEVFAFYFFVVVSLFAFNFPCQTFRPIDCLNGQRARRSWREIFSFFHILLTLYGTSEKKGKLFFDSAHCKCAIKTKFLLPKPRCSWIVEWFHVRAFFTSSGNEFRD